MTMAMLQQYFVKANWHCGNSSEYLAIRHYWQGSGRSAKVLSPEPESCRIVDLLLVALNKITKIFINHIFLRLLQVGKHIF
jgi:hypothetical protein